MGKSIIENGDFEDDEMFATPWTCPGNCGINTIAKAKQPQSGDNFNYLVAENTLGQITKAKKGETYNLTYYGYAYNYPPADENAPSGWGVQFGTDRFTDNTTKVFSEANVEPADWPFWQHTLNASANDIALTYISDNNTVFYLDNVHFECISCSKSNHTGSIVGGVIGGLAGLGLLLLALAFLYLRVLKPRRKQRAAGAGAGSEYSGRTPMAQHAYSTTTGSPAYTHPGTAQTPYSTSSHGTMDIVGSQAGHGGRGTGSNFGGLPEVSDDLSRPDHYPAYQR